MPTSSRNERTRAGCWTCRARRKKCDEARPGCNQCSKLGLRCEGYEVRLKWDSRAKASQSKKGNTIKVSQSSIQVADEPAPNEALIYYLGKEVYQSLTSTEQEIMQAFVDWGADVLMARAKIHPERYFQIFARSSSLLRACLAYQVMLDQKYFPLIEPYYIRSIEEFRRELAHSACVERQTTIYSGLVLCSISMTRGLPWTFHLNGVSSILNSTRGGIRGNDSKEPPKHYVFFIGVLDIPTHTLGRKTPQLEIWQQHCRSQPGVEDTLGLPCSLVDLLSSIAEPGVEKRLAEWSTEHGTMEQQRVWDLTRHGGIVAAHNLRLQRGQQSTIEIEGAIHHIITTTSQLKSQLGHFPYMPWSGLLFPLVMAASQPQYLSGSDQSLIIDSLTDLASGNLDQFPYYGNVVKALRQFWNYGYGRPLERVVIDMDMELGLF